MQARRNKDGYMTILTKEEEKRIDDIRKELYAHLKPVTLDEFMREFGEKLEQAAIERAKLITDTIHEIYGNYVPVLCWDNYKSIFIEYDIKSESLVTEDGISMKVDIPNENINYKSMFDFLDKFKAYVQEQYEIRYNIHLDYDW
jgi:hypothetical protein